MPTFKGQAVPNLNNKPVTLSDQHFTMPLATLSISRVQQNILAMQHFADRHQAQLAPHGKTTMCPWLFEQQLAAGSWGITVATAVQAKIASEHGVKRIILANQLVGRANCELIADMLTANDITLYCFVDNLDNVAMLAERFANAQQPLRLLIEYGNENGRCGCREAESVIQLAKQIQQLPGVTLSGLAFYEGVVSASRDDNQPIEQFLQQVCDIAEQLNSFITADATPLLTGAGSIWFDHVVKNVRNRTAMRQYQLILRPGCYVSHDHGLYQRAQQVALTEKLVSWPNLQPALLVWGLVQSRPEPELAIVSIGKRDIAYDQDLPIPVSFLHPEHDKITAVPHHWFCQRIMDQHLFLKVAPHDELSVGTVMAFGSSHPCLTFDKWSQLALLNEQNQVVKFVPTFF